MTLTSVEQSHVPRRDVGTDVKLESRDPPQHQEEDHFLKSWKFGLVITSLYLGTLLVAIDTTIITVAVPKISTVFKALKMALQASPNQLICVNSKVSRQPHVHVDL